MRRHFDFFPLEHPEARVEVRSFRLLRIDGYVEALRSACKLLRFTYLSPRQQLSMSLYQN